MSNKETAITDETSIRWASSESTEHVTQQLVIQIAETSSSGASNYLTAGSEKYTIDIPESCHSPRHDPQNERDNHISSSSHSPMHWTRSDVNENLQRSMSNSPIIYHIRSSESVVEGFVITGVGASSRRELLTPDADYLDDDCALTIVEVDSQLNIPNRRDGSAVVSVTNVDGFRNSNDITPGVQRTLKEQNQPQEQSKLYTAFFSLTGNWPIYTFNIFLITWIFFIWGIVGVIGWDQAQVSLTEPVSPPQESFLFLTVNNWPSCSSVRGNTWRLVSSQFVHAGIQHIGGNTLAGVIYGGILECTHPYHWLITLLAYQMGCIFGCLGHSYVFPFEGLLGCSTGVYALIGGTISHAILNKDVLSRKFYNYLVVSLIFQGLYDTIAYWVWYNPGIAYAGHCSAFFTGIFLVLSFGLLQKPLWKRVFGCLGLVAFLVLTISLIVHYVQSWPPSMLPYNPTSHPYDRRSCCGELYSKVNSTFSLEDARGEFNCNPYSKSIFHKR